MAGNKNDNFRALAELANMAFVLVASTMVGFFFGRYLDKWLTTSPWFTLIMLILGVATGFKAVYDKMVGPKGGS